MEKNNINVYNLRGEVVKSIELPNCFNTSMNNVLFKEVIEYFQNKNRSNYAHVKSKNDINCSNRKLFKQKGTGRARSSSPKQSQHRGGVKLFGPGGQVFPFNIPKKKIKSGLSMIISDKQKNEELIVLDSLHTENHKTKIFLEHLKQFKSNIKSCLFVDEKIEENFHLSMRNVPNMECIKFTALNALNVVRKKYLMITEKALMEITRRITNGK